MNQKDINSNDLRVQKTRKALVDAFFELSETTWIEDITIEDLCDKAMIRRATFYKHFTDRFDFYEYVLNHIQADANMEMNVHPKDVSLTDFCVNICLGFFRNYHMHPKMVKRLNTSDSRQPYSDILMNLLKSSIKQKMEYDRSRGLTSSIDSEVLSGFIAGAIPVVIAMFETGHLHGLTEEDVMENLKIIFERLCAYEVQE